MVQLWKGVSHTWLLMGQTSQSTVSIGLYVC